MRMDEIGIPVQDCRVSKLFSSIAGRPAKLFDEKSSKLYSCHTKLSEHIWGRTKKKWGDVTAHDVMKGNKMHI